MITLHPLSVLANDRTLVGYAYVGYLLFIVLVSKKKVSNKFEGLLGILRAFLLLVG